MKLRFRFPKTPQPHEIEVAPETELQVLSLMLEELSQLPAYRLVLLHGFPPKRVEASAATPVGSVFREGDMITVQEGEGQVKQGHTNGRYIPPCDEKGIFVKRNCPADDSCMFHSVAYVCEKKSRTISPMVMREKIAEAVVLNKSRFTKTYLGRSPEEYASWIMHPSSWGGEPELRILSFLYQTELVVCDTSSGAMLTFGDGEGCTTRAFLAYTGKHYDALAVRPMMSTAEADDQEIFSTSDQRALALAKRFLETEGPKKAK